MKKNLIQYFIRIEAETLEEIKKLGRQDDRNMSNMTRVLIKEAIKNRKEK